MTVALQDWNYRGAAPVTGPYLGDASAVTLKKQSGRTLNIPALTDTDAERGAAFQTAISEHVAGDSIELSGGTHLLSAPVELKEFVSLRGNGNTILKLDDLGSADFTQQKSIIFGVSATRTSRVRISDITFNCNLDGQSASNACVGAVLIYGGNYSEIRNCRAINWGTKSASIECFIFIINNYLGLGASHGCRIENCGVDTPAPAATHGAGGTTAFSIAGTSAVANTVDAGWVSSPEIVGCIAHDITTGTTAGKPYYFNMLGLGNAYAPSLFRNTIYNVGNTGGAGQSFGLYLDTGGSIQLLNMTGNNFAGGTSFTGVKLIPTAGLVISNAMFSNNLFNIGDAGFHFEPASAGGVIDVQIVNNRIKEFSGSTKGLHLLNTTRVLANNNIINVDTPFNDVSGNTTFTHVGNYNASGVGVDS